MKQATPAGRKGPATLKSKTSPAAPAKPLVNATEYPLTRENYILMLVGMVIVILGFFLMSGKTDIYDFRKITLAPLVVVAGFVFEIYAIMKRPKPKE